MEKKTSDMTTAVIATLSVASEAFTMCNLACQMSKPEPEVSYCTLERRIQG